MAKTKRPNYAFIDGANLHFGVRSQNWRMDYKKFRLYLKNKYNIGKAFIFIGWIEDNQELYDHLKKDGFELVFKPTVSYMEKGSLTQKGNVDAELVLYAAAIEYDNYDKAIIVTSDGDFACLLKFLIEKKKLKKIITPTGKYSSLLSPFRDHIVLIRSIKTKITRAKKNQKPKDNKKAGIGDRSKP